ncbi:MAG TPA: DUF2802 domain-containing protein [Rhodocyclaceae bacterium]|nr:DUF2802 domain-containing protein [Rhodocyclaceae bacterium]
MDNILDLLAGLGWREAILLWVIILTIYFVVMVLRLLQLPRSGDLRNYDLQAPEMKTPPPEFDAPPGSVLAGVWETPTEPSLMSQPSMLERAIQRVRPPEAPAAPMEDFATQLTHKSLENEVRQLREQLTDARNEMGRLRDEVAQLHAAQKVSPLYNEAMALAVRGVDAAGVAGRCGISIAEAELVVALSKKPAPPPILTEQDEDMDGGTYGRNGRF